MALLVMIPITFLLIIFSPFLYVLYWVLFWVYHLGILFIREVLFPVTLVILFECWSRIFRGKSMFFEEKEVIYDQEIYDKYKHLL